jgi:hypothetical protein
VAPEQDTALAGALLAALAEIEQGRP